MSRTSWNLLGILVSAWALCGCSSILGDFSLGEALSEDGSLSPGDGSPASEATARDDGATGRDATERPTDAAVTEDRDATGSGTTADADAGTDGDARADADAADCGAGAIRCSGSCLSSSDLHNCGTCGHDCARLANTSIAGLACMGGRCIYQCASGYADCADAGSGCGTNLSSSPNCGACGTGCANGTPFCAATDAGANACVSGCPSTQPTMCMGSCVNEQTSAQACGGCGTGYACAAGLTCQSGQCVGPNLALSPLQFAFATTTVGATSASQPFVVTNSGNGPSGALATAIGGTNPAEFSLVADGCKGQTIAAGASCTVSAQFAPTGRGPKSAALDINGGQLFAALTATGEDTVTLTVTKSGTGGGVISGDQIACGSVCSEQVTRATTSDPTITLTAVPDATSVFSGWSGACSGTSPSCAVTMSQAQTVNAQFDRQTVALTVTGRVFGPASGTLASSPAGIQCTVPCTQSVSVPVGSSVTLTSTGGPLVWWGAGTGCSGSTCSVLMTAAVNLTVTFSGNNFVFVSSTTHDGNLGGLSGADAMCNQAASKASLPGTYVAWLATSTTNALSRLGSARGWIRPDGLPFADTTNALKNGQILYPPQISELGQAVGNEVYTGANADGSLVTGTGQPNFNCNDFTSNTAAQTAACGGSIGGSWTWTAGQGVSCNLKTPIYCFGTDLANAVTFTPATGRHAFLSTGLFTPSSGLGSADTLCRSEAASANLTNAANFLAMLSPGTTSAVSRFNLSGANWVRRDGIPITNTPADVENGLVAAMTVHADGTYTNGFVAVAAGASFTSSVGTAATTCSNWSSTSGNLGEAEAGYGGFVWFEFSTASCAGTYNVFCFEN
jgi:List-Bact-rpt repeat protein